MRLYIAFSFIPDSRIVMTLSAAERARRYRAKRDANPVKRAEYLEKERKKWHADVASGKVKTVATMSKREI